MLSTASNKSLYSHTNIKEEEFFVQMNNTDY